MMTQVSPLIFCDFSLELLDRIVLFLLLISFYRPEQCGAWGGVERGHHGNEAGYAIMSGQ